MGSFFQQYGVEEERRGRAIKAIVLACLGIALLVIVGYFVLHDYSEKQVVKRFLQQINARNYQKLTRNGVARQRTPVRITAITGF